jgi:hypothetical protein
MSKGAKPNWLTTCLTHPMMQPGTIRVSYMCLQATSRFRKASDIKEMNRAGYGMTSKSLLLIDEII